MTNDDWNAMTIYFIGALMLFFGMSIGYAIKSLEISEVDHALYKQMTRDHCAWRLQNHKYYINMTDDGKIFCDEYLGKVSEAYVDMYIEK